MPNIYKLLSAIVICFLFISCGTSDKNKAFFPSSHEVTIDRASLKRSSVRDGYVKYNREAILKKVAEDDRFAPLIEQAKESVEQLASMSDSELRALILPAKTKRALMVHRRGCPLHEGGTAVYQPFGIKVDLDYPLQVKCPLAGEVYPNKDFPDDGQGWVDNRPDSPTEGETYYFVGWFQHWFLQSLPGRIKTLAQLWFLTGEERYGRTAHVLIERFMEEYPGMDGNDLTYDGTDWGVYVKMLPTMWEGSALRSMTEGVELLLPILDDDFLERYQKSVFRPAFEAYREKPAPSNWGNVWNAPFAKFVNVTGDMEILDYMLWEHPVAVVPTLDNQYFRDGFPYEAAFSYGSHYIYDDRDIADEMGANGNWIWEHPNMKASFNAFAELVCLDRFTHFFGDTGGLKNTGLTIQPGLLEEAYRRYGTPVIARYLLQAYDVNGMKKTVSIDGLFTENTKPDIDLDEVRVTAAQAEPFKSTLSPVRGFAIMRTGAGDERTELFFDYGYAHPAHSHADRLNINLFTAGREFIPEMGYPEYMDSIAPTPGGWTTHTVCHATVEVDEKRQLEGAFGDLHGFIDADGIKYVDASCEDAYVHCDVDLYRRTLALIDVPGGAYVVDIFRVGGGKQHDYLFHGPPVDVKLQGVELSKPHKGTLAGENVAFGEKPDDVLPYHVDNKGYQYLYDVQECQKETPYSAQWQTEEGHTFAVSFIPEGSETFYLTKGYPRPSSKTLPPMPFLVRRKNPEGSDVSQFVSLMNVDKKGAEPLMMEIRRIELSANSDPTACGVYIKHRYGEDVVLSTLSENGYAASKDGRFELKGQFGAVSWRDGSLERSTLVRGTRFVVDDREVTLESAITTASITQTYDNKLVLGKALPTDIAGQVITVDRLPVQSAYWVDSVDGTTVHVSPGTWIGRGRVDRYDSGAGTIYDRRDIFPLGEKRNRLADITGMKYPEGNRNYYAGSWLISEDGSAGYRLTSGGYPGFVLDKQQDLSGLESSMPVGTTFLLYDVGPGDTVRVVNYKQVVY